MVRIGVIGDFNAKHHTHIAINTAVKHVASALGMAVSANWVPTSDLEARGADMVLSGYDALWAAPASPYRSAEGMLRGIEYARFHDVPFTGT